MTMLLQAACIQTMTASWKPLPSIMKWYSKHGLLKDMDNAPRVAVLLYR